MLRGAERVWPTRYEAQPNGEGVASGGATKKLQFFWIIIQQSLILPGCVAYQCRVSVSERHNTQ